MQAIEEQKQISTSGVVGKKVAVVFLRERGWQVIPKELRGDVGKELGPYFKENSIDTKRGLEPVLEAEILPTYIGYDRGTPDFQSKAKEFWLNWSFECKLEGTELDITTEKRKIPSLYDPKVMVEVDYPLNVKDFMDFNMITGNPLVAQTKEQLEGVENYEYYMINKADKEAEEELLHDIKKQAMIEYSKLVTDTKGNKGKILQILEVTKEAGDFVDLNMTDSQMERLLLERVSQTLKVTKKGELYLPFLKAVTDGNLGTKALLSQLHYHNVISKEGNTYFYGDESLGNMKEAVAKLSSPTFASDRLKMEKRLEDAIKNN